MTDQVHQQVENLGLDRQRFITGTDPVTGRFDRDVADLVVHAPLVVHIIEKLSKNYADIMRRMGRAGTRNPAVSSPPSPLTPAIDRSGLPVWVLGRQ